MAGDLIIPRCEVFWDDVNLTYYKDSANWPGVDGPQPLVYDVRVNIQESSQTPNGSMKWNPSGRAFSVYEELISTKYDKTITVRFYYLTGKSITFSFVWAGQVENYGNEMTIEVKLASELDGLILSSIRNVSQSDETGVSMKSAISELEKLYGVGGLNLIQFHPTVDKDLDKPKLKSNYSEGSTFSGAIENMAEQNGNLAFLHNIRQGNKDTGIVMMPPYTWQGKVDTAASIIFPTPQLQSPDPKTRYAYFLGPVIINSLVKTSEWTPPQKNQTYTLNSQPRVQTSESPNGGRANPTPTQAGDTETRGRQRVSGGASGTSGASSRPGMRLGQNEDGEKKKLILQEERTAKLSATLFMCPALTGIKPHDILFIPNYAGTYIEDWIVTSVEYEQSKGGVTIGVQAARRYASGNLMHEPNGKLALDTAKTVNLVGDKASVESWVNYAWSFK